MRITHATKAMKNNWIKAFVGGHGGVAFRHSAFAYGFFTSSMLCFPSNRSESLPHVATLRTLSIACVSICSLRLISSSGQNISVWQRLSEKVSVAAA